MRVKKELPTQTGINRNKAQYHNSVIPCFSEVHIMPLCFYESPPLAPGLAERNPEDFHLHDQRQKAKIAFSFYFAPGQGGGIMHPSQQVWPCEAPSPGSTLSILASSCCSFEL